MERQVPVSQQVAEGRDLSRVVSELRQWHVFRVAGAYAVIAWLVVQIVATIGPAFDFPEWILRAVVLIAIAGFLGTMAFMLFRPRSAGRSPTPVYLSPRARLVAGFGVLIVAAAAAALAVRSLRSTEEISLAVLPFNDLSPTHDKGYFSEGVAEEILSTLSAEKDLAVLGSTSARQIDRSADPRAVRKALGVTHLLEGSTRVFGNDLRVNVRLVDTSNGRQLWEEEYRGGLSDVFRVQDQVANAVVRRLRGTILPEQVKSAPTTSIDAYETYLAARALLRKNTTPEVKRAWQMARQIVTAHPDYAPGHALLAETTMNLSDAPYSYTAQFSWSKAQPFALHHAREAIRLAPDRAEGYAALGLALPLEQRLAVYKRALALDPSISGVRLRLALALDELQRPDEAFEHYRQAVEMDPLSPALVNRYVQMLAASGRVEDATHVIDLFEARSGLHAQSWRFRGAVQAYHADLSRAVLARERALQLDPGLPYQREWLARYFHLLGFRERLTPFAAQLPFKLLAFVSDNRGALSARVQAEGPSTWFADGLDLGLFSLARARDWAAITRLYDDRPAERRNLCTGSPTFLPVIAMSLRQAGRQVEADRLMACAQSQISRLLKMRYRSPDAASGELEMVQASLLALKNDTNAVKWLKNAVQRGWIGQYYSSKLTDWPQFDSIRSDPEYVGVQNRIDAVVTRERSDVLAKR